MESKAESAAQSGVEKRSGGALPTAVVIGAQKCGTSALWYYLRHHPGASVSTPKELDFFITSRNWKQGVDWYKGHFDAAKPVRVDASPNYTAHPVHQGVMERMAKVLPEAKLVYLVRDPIDRIAAQWIHNYAVGRHTGDLAVMFNKARSTYVPRSCYAMQIEVALAHFPSDRLMVIDQDDLRNDRAATLRRIFAHLDLDPDVTHEAFNTQRNKTARKRILTPLGRKVQDVLPPPVWRRVRNLPKLQMAIPMPDVRAAMPAATLQLLRDDAKRFGELTGMDTSHWSVWK